MAQLLTELQNVMVEITRYPASLFTPEADFEEELGIDSVKLAEIFAVLQKRNLLPKDLNGEGKTIRNLKDLMGHIQHEAPAHPKLTTTAASTGNPGVQSLLERMTGTRTGILPAENLIPDPPSRLEPRNGKRLQRGKAEAGITQEAILAVFTEATRYPEELFRDEAHLEEDLGIDSVKQAEILAALGQRFALGETTLATFKGLDTVGEIIERLQNTSADSLLPATESLAATYTSRHPIPGDASVLDKGPGAQPFAGKVALVTGSGHGIGAAIARRLSLLGATVVINSFHSRTQGEALVEELRDRGGKALHCWGSVAKQEHLEDIFATVQQHFGTLDFFVHSASNGLLAPLEEIQPQHWDKAFRTNIVGFHQGALLASKLMDRSKGGRMLALSSIGAQRVFEHFGCMGPIKAALESLVRYLALHFKDQNIGVNALSIGPVAGDLIQRYPDSQRLTAKWSHLTSGGELITEDEVADAATYLLSPLSKRVSGSIHLLDGTLSLPV